MELKNKYYMGITLEYLVYKELQIAFSQEQEKIFDEMNIHSYVFINSLKSFVYRNINTGFINEKVRQMIYNLIEQIRYGKEFQSFEEKKEVFEMCNDIISKLNVIDLSLSKRFAKIEAYKRYFDVDTEFYEFKKETISFDFQVTNDLILPYSENLKKYTLDDEFLSSVNAILYEQPYILEDENFLNNLCSILLENLLICEKILEENNNKKIKNSCLIHDTKYIKSRTLYLLRRLTSIVEKKHIKKISNI